MQCAAKNRFDNMLQDITKAIAYCYAANLVQTS